MLQSNYIMLKYMNTKATWGANSMEEKCARQEQTESQLLNVKKFQSKRGMGPPREHIELMSLPRRPWIKTLPETKLAGLPINSLPGWEDIPLNCKLPMLKCPGNEVIFSKNKIGQTFKIGKYEFDLSMSMNDDIPEYNPLHDNNMKLFYTTKQNLKRLRENGEITENNDVICNLKDFNRYRAELHKSNLYLMLQNQTKIELDQKDMKMIEHADNIRSRAYGSLWARCPDVSLRKQILDEKRQQKNLRAIEKSDEKFARVEAYRKMQASLLEHRKALNKLKMERHWENFLEINRKHLIYLKKLLQSKRERSRKHMRKYYEQREKESREKKIVAWEKRLNERLEQQARIKQLLKEAEINKKIYINNYATKFREMWERTERKIQQRGMEKQRIASKKSHRRKKESAKTESRRSITQEYRETFEKLLDTELCDALNTAINMEENIQVPFMPDDPIYKAATFITEQIIRKYDKDLNCDRVLRKLVKDRLLEYFEEATKFVLFRASQIIFAARNAIKNETFNLGSINCLTCRENRSLSKLVAFSKVSSTIGTSSYSIHPLIKVKSVGERQKTPPGSLTSIVLDTRESMISRTRADHLQSYDMVFVEHFIIKFKRELVVGMGRRVFAAIRCHYHGKIMDVNQDLLDVDKKFLAKQGAEAILGYAKNPINFKSVVRFCISALSNRLIWSLQKILLKPDRDPRGIVSPTQGCPDLCDFQEGLCLYCIDCMYEPCKDSAEEETGEKADVECEGVLE